MLCSRGHPRVRPQTVSGSGLTDVLSSLIEFVFIASDVIAMVIARRTARFFCAAPSVYRPVSHV